MHGFKSTVESRFKKAWFKKESRFKMIVGATDFLVHKTFDLRKLFQGPMHSALFYPLGYIFLSKITDFEINIVHPRDTLQCAF